MSNFADRNRARVAACARLDAAADGFQMTPITVTVHLGSPIALARPSDLALDGILAYGLLHEALGGDFALLPPPETGPIFCRLPLALQGDSALVARLRSYRWGRLLDIAADLTDAPWWYACSTLIWDVWARDTHHWNRHLASHRVQQFLDPRVADVVTEKGPYKGYHQPLPVMHTDTLVWECVGDGDAIAAILRRTFHLGHKRAYGYAAIRDVAVAPAVRDGSLFTSAGGFARPVPMTALAALGVQDFSVAAWRVPPARQQQAYRAPQWLPYHQSLCLAGGERA